MEQANTSSQAEQTGIEVVRSGDSNDICENFSSPRQDPARLNYKGDKFNGINKLDALQQRHGISLCRQERKEDTVYWGQSLATTIIHGVIVKDISLRITISPIYNLSLETCALCQGEPDSVCRATDLVFLRVDELCPESWLPDIESRVLSTLFVKKE